MVSHRHQIVCRVHALLADLSPSGAKGKITADLAARKLRSIRPVTLTDHERRRSVLELIEEWRWIHRRIPNVEARIRDTPQVHGTTLTDIFGIAEIGAATIIAAVGDVHRFPSCGHFAAYNGTAPLDASSGDIHRHRLSRKGNRHLNAVLHIAAVSQIRWDTPRTDLLPPQARRAQDQRQSPQGAQTAAVQRGLPPPALRRPPTRSGPRRTDGNGTRVRVTG
jgi:transposase